jgi:hypothetical protein
MSKNTPELEPKKQQANCPKIQPHPPQHQSLSGEEKVQVCPISVLCTYQLAGATQGILNSNADQQIINLDQS